MSEKKQTHGDYIRSMTDDQLSMLLNDTMPCDFCIHGDRCTNPYNSSRCIDGVAEYLGRERMVDDGQEKEEPGAGEGCAGADAEGNPQGLHRCAEPQE